MKTTFHATTAKLTLAILLFVSAAGLQAQTANPAPAERTPQVRYLGTQQDDILFEVSYDNPAASRFTVMVTDKEGNTLFQEAFTEKKFGRKFKFASPENSKLTFTIRSGKEADFVQSFVVKTEFTEDVVVTKL